METGPSGEGNSGGNARLQYFLPSQLGSEVGNAPLGTLEAAEKAHMDLVVAGMVEHALDEQPQPPHVPLQRSPPLGGSANMHAGMLVTGETSRRLRDMPSNSWGTDGEGVCSAGGGREALSCFPCWLTLSHWEEAGWR